MTSAGAARNKARGADDEREFARIIGGRRHHADTGGPEDIDHPLMAVQHKGGKTVVTSIMRDALAAARRAGAGNGRLPAVGLTDRRGTRLVRWLCFEAEAFVEWVGARGKTTIGEAWVSWASGRWPNTDPYHIAYEREATGFAAGYAAALGRVDWEQYEEEVA